MSCGGDAIRSTNDTDEALGWISISNSTLNLTAGEDGIQAETALTLTSGVYTLDCSDDAVHAGGDVTVSGGTVIVSSTGRDNGAPWEDRGERPQDGMPGGPRNPGSQDVPPEDGTRQRHSGAITDGVQGGPAGKIRLPVRSPDGVRSSFKIRDCFFWNPCV